MKIIVEIDTDSEGYREKPKMCLSTVLTDIGWAIHGNHTPPPTSGHLSDMDGKTIGTWSVEDAPPFDWRTQPRGNW